MQKNKRDAKTRGSRRLARIESCRRTSANQLLQTSGDASF